MKYQKYLKNLFREISKCSICDSEVDCYCNDKYHTTFRGYAITCELSLSCHGCSTHINVGFSNGTLIYTSMIIDKFKVSILHPEEKSFFYKLKVTESSTLTRYISVSWEEFKMLDFIVDIDFYNIKKFREQVETMIVFL